MFLQFLQKLPFYPCRREHGSFKKLEKAAKLNVPIMNEDDFLRKVGEDVPQDLFGE